MMVIDELNLPAYPFKIKEEGNKNYIFDEIRKKFVFLSPEEWVRQHFIQFLIRHRGYSKSLIAVERGLKLHDRHKRTDILVYDQRAMPYLLVECKASSVKITQETFDQAARYNFVHQVKYMVLTNGLKHYVCQLDYVKGAYHFLAEVPGPKSYIEP